MWRQLSIKTQLFLLITLLVSFILVISLGITYNYSEKESKQLASTKTVAIAKSLNKEILQTILDPSKINITDMTHRAEVFNALKSLQILDKNNQPIFNYGNPKNHLANELKLNQPVFTEKRLLLKLPIRQENLVAGSLIIEIDLSAYQKRHVDHLLSLLIIFPIGLLLTLIISGVLSKTFTHPFNQLAEAMAKNDVAKNQFHPIKTKYKNEIGRLFEGYNKMINTLESTSKDLQHQAEHDALTGLYNRFFLEKTAENILNKAENKLNSLVLIDLDQFGIINNSAGFHEGDKLLKMVAETLQQQLPSNTFLARIAGDDFLLLIENESQQKSLDLINQLLDSLADFRFSANNIAYSTSATMGVVFFKPNEYSLTQLSKAVHTAFYSAKAKGRGKLVIYSESDQSAERYNTDLKIAKDIKQALSKTGKARFELFAQAIVPLQHQTEQIGYEILIRMWDSAGNFVPPDEFLPTAERYQLMAEIDMYVLWNFLEIVTAEPEHLKKLHSAHVNLTGSSLNNPDFQAKVKEAVEHFVFPWNKLELEITETSAVGNFNQAKSFIEYFRNLGIGLALDDFGTGMSSFEYLKSLPFDVVKIDGCFIKDMHTDPTDKAIIRHIHEISGLRNQKTVAEYVESQTDLTELTKIGITYGQGYFLGKPKPLTDWL